MAGWSKSSVLGSQVSGVEVLDGETTVFVLGGFWIRWLLCMHRTFLEINNHRRFRKLLPYTVQVLVALTGVNWRISRSAAQCFRGESELQLLIAALRELSCDKHQHSNLTVAHLSFSSLYCDI